MSLRRSGILQVITISTVLIFVGAVIWALKYFAAQEQTYKFYATYEDAKRDGAITRGWVPNFVPTAAFQIQEKHDLDSNAQWLKFKFPPAGGKSMIAGMMRLDGSLRPSQISNPNESWWRVNANPLLEIYKVPGDGGYLGVDWAKSDAYYWNK
jgi:hypothetical protein